MKRQHRASPKCISVIGTGKQRGSVWYSEPLKDDSSAGWARTAPAKHSGNTPGLILAPEKPLGLSTAAPTAKGQTPDGADVRKAFTYTYHLETYPNSSYLLNPCSNT